MLAVSANVLAFESIKPLDIFKGDLVTISRHVCGDTKPEVWPVIVCGNKSKYSKPTHDV